MSDVKDVSREPAGSFVVDDSGRPRLRVVGAEAARFVHGFCTADVTGMAVGQIREAFFTTIKGRVLSYAVVERQESAVEISLFEDSSETLRAHLAKYAAIEPVEVVAAEPAPRRLVVGRPSEGVRWPFEVGPVTACDEPIETDPDGADRWEQFRVRCGIPRVGVDVGERTLVQEAGRTAQAVSFEKGCYLGQEPIARLDAMGHTNKELRVLELPSDAFPKRGDVVVFDSATVGEVTSVASCDNATWAIATLRTAANGAGTVVHVSGFDAIVRPPR